MGGGRRRDSNMSRSKTMEQEKTRQLGMSSSRAGAKLTRIVLFDIVRRSGLNICLRCGAPIETIAEFSLDHEKPWLHVSADLFWDVNNIKFSHRRCNSGARRSRPQRCPTKVPKEIKRARFKSWYAKPENKIAHNRRRRERYAQKNTGSSSSG